MDFKQVEERFEFLKSKFAQGTLSEADFKAQLEELMIQDEQGDWWMIGYETGQWYRNDGNDWVRAEPPGHISKLSGQNVVVEPAAKTKAKEAERIAAQKAEEERAVKQKEQAKQVSKNDTEQDRSTKDKVNTETAAVPVAEVSQGRSGRMPVSSRKLGAKGWMYYVATFVLVCGGVGFGIFSFLNRSSPSTDTDQGAITALKTPTNAPTKVVVPTNVSMPVTEATARPTNTPLPLPTSEPAVIEVDNFTTQGTWKKVESCPGNKNPCWQDSPSDLYANDMYYSLTSDEILVGATWENPYLIYWQKYNTEGEYDFLQISINGLPVRTNSGTQDWHQIAINLESFKGQEIVISFLIATDFSIVGDGWYLNDIKIIPNATTQQLNSARIVDP